jgi:hypothetical protein
MDSHSKEPLSTYILLVTVIAVALGFLIWQLTSLHFYDQLSFYFGVLIITAYQILLYGLFYITRHSKERKILFYFWVSVVMIWIALGVGLIAPFSHVFNVPPILFFITYFLLFFAIGIIELVLRSKRR